MKKLYKSKSNKVLFGVIGGIGEYADIDPVILRLIFLLIVLVTAVVPGIVLYLVAGMIVPQAPSEG